MRYLIQFPAGTGDLVLDAILPYAHDFKLSYRDDSAMIFDTASPESRVASIPFAKNAFAVIASTPRTGIDEGVSRLGRLAGPARFPPGAARGGRFRTMVQIDGELSAVGPQAKTALERAIGAKTGQRVEPRGRCQEYWVIGRRDLGDLLLGARLPRADRPAKARGALSYELAAMLVAASRPVPPDVFLDPFAGSGALVQARSESPARRIWYSDAGLSEFRAGFPAALARDKRVGFLDDDALSLASLPDGGVDVIVTDPPWGEHEDIGLPYPEFARAMVRSFARVLRRPAGRLVVLTSRQTAGRLEQALADGGLPARSAHEILVNGHPATVLVGPA